MAKHLLRDLEKLKKELLLLGAMVEDAAHKAVLSLVDRRGELAKEVIEGDRDIDDKEVQVDEDCLKLLALHQPVAADLRFVVAAMKVNNDLERVGDLAGNLAGRALFLAEREPIKVPAEIEKMAATVRAMLRDSLTAFVQGDTDMARQVVEQDEEVDTQHKELYGLFADRFRDQPDKVEFYIQLLSVSRYLERMADLATNIAEDVVFMVDGDVVRHRTSW
ncbi:MAG: phosphate signaling complex protein PhoU [Acidobacteriota bacterium]